MKTAFRCSGGLRLVLIQWSDWSWLGVREWSKVLRAAILLRLHEARLYRQSVSKNDNKYSQEFMDWVTQWLG